MITCRIFILLYKPCCFMVGLCFKDNYRLLLSAKTPKSINTAHPTNIGDYFIDSV